MSGPPAAPSPTASLPPAPNPTSVSGPLTLYVASRDAKAIVAYRAPLSASSTPAFQIATSGFPDGIGISGSTLAVIDESGTISIFNAPFSGSSAPAATFPSTLGPLSTKPFSAVGGGAFAGEYAFASENLTFDPSGNLWAVISNSDASTTNPAPIVEFKPPFSASSVPSLTVTTPYYGVTAIAVDSAENLYVSVNLVNPLTHVALWNPPYTAEAAKYISNFPPYTGFPGHAGVYEAVAISGNQFFMEDFGFGASTFTLPNTAQVTGYVGGTQLGLGATFDARGNVFTDSPGCNCVHISLPPFPATPFPPTAYSIPITNGLAAPLGLAIGP